MSSQEIQRLEHDPLQHLDEAPYSLLARHQNLTGCFSIIGPVRICYSQIGSGFKVCLQLAGREVACANIDPTNPCQTIEGSVILAKASVEVCIKDNCLTYAAQACYRTTPFSSWECTSSSGTIICF